MLLCLLVIDKSAVYTESAPPEAEAREAAVNAMDNDSVPPVTTETNTLYVKADTSGHETFTAGEEKTIAHYIYWTDPNEVFGYFLMGYLMITFDPAVVEPVRAQSGAFSTRISRQGPGWIIVDPWMWYPGESDPNLLAFNITWRGLQAGTTGFDYTVTDSSGNYRGYFLTGTVHNMQRVTALVEFSAQPPAAPSNLVATAISHNQINLTWQDNSDNEDGFKIERSSDGVNFYERSIVSDNTASYSDIDLQDGFSYHYRVKAYNAVGDGDYSNIATAITFLNPPTNLAVTAVSPFQNNLQWTDNSLNEIWFRIERSTDNLAYEQIADAKINTSVYFDTGLIDGTTYYYRVFVYNSKLSSGYSNVSVSTTPLKPPSSLIANTISDSQVNLQWQDISLSEQGFRIERKTGISGSWELIATSSADSTNYSDTGLVESTLYYYRLKAFNANGESNYSNEIFASTFPKILTTSELENLTDAYYQSGDIKSQGIYKSLLAKFSSGTISQLNAFCNELKAQDNKGVSHNAATDLSAQATKIINYSAPLNPPSNLNATAISTSQINLNWTDNSYNEIGFKIERKKGTDDIYQQIATVGPDLTSYYDVGLEEGVTYYYRLYVFNNSGISAYSNETSATPFESTPLITYQNQIISRSWDINLYGLVDLYQMVSDYTQQMIDHDGQDNELEVIYQSALQGLNYHTQMTLGQLDDLESEAILGIENIVGQIGPSEDITNAVYNKVKHTIEEDKRNIKNEAECMTDVLSHNKSKHEGKKKDYEAKGKEYLDDWNVRIKQENPPEPPITDTAKDRAYIFIGSTAGLNQSDMADVVESLKQKYLKLGWRVWIMDGDDATKEDFLGAATSTTTAGLGYVGHASAGFLALPPPPGADPDDPGGLLASDPDLKAISGTSLEELDLLGCNTGLPQEGTNDYLSTHLLPDPAKVTEIYSDSYAGMLKRIADKLAETLDPSQVDTTPTWWESLRILAGQIAHGDL